MTYNISSQGVLVNFFIAGTKYLVTTVKEEGIYFSSQLKAAVHHDRDAMVGGPWSSLVHWIHSQEEKWEPEAQPME